VVAAEDQWEDPGPEDMSNRPGYLIEALLYGSRQQEDIPEVLSVE